MIGLTMALCALSDVTGALTANATPQYGVWSGSSGPGTVTINDGTSGPPSFQYDDESAGFSPVSWTFSTTEQQAATGGNGLTVDVPWQYTGLHAWFEVTVDLNAFITTPSGTTTTQLVNAGPTSCCTAPSNGFSYQGTYSFTGLQQGDVYGFTFGGSNFDSNNFLRGTLQLYPNSSPVISPPTGNTSWQNATALKANDSVSTDAIDAPGEDRWYDFPVQPDSQVTVNVSGLTSDTDVAVFSDIGQAFQQDLDTFGSGTADTSQLTELAAQQPSSTAAPADFAPSAFTPSAFTPSAFTPSAFTPSAFTPSAFTPSAFTPSAFTPSAFTPSAFTPSAFTPSAFTPSAFTPSAFTAAYSSAQVRSLLAVSSQPGAAPKSVTVNTWNATGNFYVRVTGENGAYSTTPFTLTVTTTGGPCNNISLNSYSGDSTISASPGDNYQTVILTDSSRLGSPDLTTALTNLAATTNGVVVDLADSQKVQDLQTQADLYSSCPYASNLVANAIRDIITSYRAGGSLKYVVLVGGDRVIPYFRYADDAGLAPESDYVPPLSSTSRTGAALESNDYLTDDPYGASTILDTQNLQIPIPDLAVGRLVETAPEITGQINDYLADNGSLPAPASSLVTGYDFLQPVADQVESQFEAGMGPGTQHDQLITNQGVPPSQTTTASGPDRNHSWTATDLSNALFGSHHDLVFLGGHFSANNTLAADYTTTLVTTDMQAAVQANPNLFKNTLVISAGCHAGYNIQDQDGVPGVTLGLDWPEEFGSAGATLISGTGYQYGDTDFVAYSDKLYTDVAQQLHAGTGRLAIGQVLEAAKQQYLQQVPQMSGMDTKALLETTLYGLPMLGIDMPAGRASTTPPGNGSVTPTPVTQDPGATLGLEEQDFSTDPELQTHNEAITDTNGNPTGQQFTWLSGPQGVTTQPGQPALPLQTADVTSTDGTVLRGVGFWGGSYTDTGGTIPLVGAPATETSQVHVPFESPVFFPQTLATPNYYGALAGSGGTSLQITPAQLQADGATTDVLRAYQHVSLHLFYSGNTQKYGDNVPALSAAPTISEVSSQVNGDGSISVSAHVAGDPSAGVHEVWVTYTGQSAGDPDYGSWHSVDLTQNGSDSTLWTGTINPADPTQAADLRFMVQAVNGVGVVALDNNGGSLYAPGTMPGFSSATSTATTLALNLPTTTGTYGGTAALSAVLTDAQGTPLKGQQVIFSLGAVNVSASTDATGTAQASIPLLAVPGQYAVSASFSGDSGDLPSSAAAQTYTIQPPPTNLTISPSDGTDPSVVDGTDTGVSATLTSNGQPLAGEPISFLVTDSQGNAVSSTVRTTDGNGTAHMGALKVAPGNNTVTASFDESGVQVGGAVVDASEPGYQGSTATTHVHGIEPTQTQLTASTTTPTYGSPVTLTATVALAGGNGTVTFAVGGTTISGCGQESLTPGSSGDTATCTIPAWNAGSYQAVASYSGATDYQSSMSQPLSVTMSQASTSTTLTAPASSTWGGTIQLSATVTPSPSSSNPSAANPTGTVTFYDGNVPVGSPVPVAVNGNATLTLPKGGVIPAAGTHNWLAVYSGDTNYVGSQHGASTVISQAATQTTLATPPGVFGQPVTVTATVTPTDAGGQLAFFVDGSTTAACTVPVTVVGSSATGSCKLSGLGVGKHSVGVTFSHDSNLLNSSASGTVLILPAWTTTSLVVPASARFGTSVSLGVSVAPVAPGAGKPTGTVTFYDGLHALGTASLTTHSSGPSTASLTVANLPGGPNALGAVYGGDNNFIGSLGIGLLPVTFTSTVAGTSKGALTVAANQAVLISGTENGSITVKAGGAVEITGSVIGSLSASGAAQLMLCGANVNGSISSSAATGQVFIGGDFCSPTKVVGSVSLSSNTGGVEIAGSNISGSLACSSNKPAPTDAGQPNKVGGSRSGQCATPVNF
ncbi:MAG TPA: Ig-like domain repeat protein [Mycobacteriales bacterium]|nr:Ig-like domain repeat protein [Mycobacteriales bacterium]